MAKVRTVHHGLDRQGQDKDSRIARGADEAESRVDSHLAAVEPGDGTGGVLEAEEENQDRQES